MESCLRYQLVPTISTRAALEGMAGAMKRWKVAARETWERLKEREGACLEEIGALEEYLKGFDCCGEGLGCKMEKCCLTSEGCCERNGVNVGKVWHNGLKCDVGNGVNVEKSCHNGLKCDVNGCLQNGVKSACHPSLNCDVEDVAWNKVNGAVCKENSACKQIAQNKNLKAESGDKKAINPEKVGPVPELCLNSASSPDPSVIENQTGCKTNRSRLNGSALQLLQPAQQLLRDVCCARVAQLREELSQLRQQLINLVPSAAAAETNKKYDVSQGLKNVISESDTNNPGVNNPENDRFDNGVSERKNWILESDENSTSLNETNGIKIKQVKHTSLMKQNLEFPANLTYRCGLPLGTVHIKVDTGMSRNGCQPQDLDSLVQACRDLGVPLEGIFSHIASHEEPDFSQQQMDSFQKCTEKYQGTGLIFHISNSGAICYDIGTDMDMVRPGLSMFGMPAGPDLDEFISQGFRPALSVRGTPTLVKLCHKGTKVGYGGTYTCEEDQWIGTFPLGYADGYWRETGQIGGQFVVRESTGERCPLVGRISMDAITVRLPEEPKAGEVFSIVTPDFDPVSSVTGIAEHCRTIQNEALIRITARLPRVYSTHNNPIHSVWSALDLDLAMADDYSDLLGQN